MTPKLAAHLRKNLTKRKRLAPSFFFDDNGKLRDIVKEACVPNADFLSLTPYNVAIPSIMEENKWELIQNWLAENCKFGWIPWNSSISFIDQADAALFALYRSEFE